MAVTALGPTGAVIDVTPDEEFIATAVMLEDLGYPAAPPITSTGSPPCPRSHGCSPRSVAACWNSPATAPAWGDGAAIAERVAEHRRAGADHVAVMLVNQTDQLNSWKSLAHALLESEGDSHEG